MLTVVITPATTALPFVRGGTIDWHVGEPPPRIDPLRIIEVQIDGDELEYIENVFQDLPVASDQNHVVRYFGDMARFIVMNLPRSKPLPKAALTLTECVAQQFPEGD